MSCAANGRAAVDARKRVAQGPVRGYIGEVLAELLDKQFIFVTGKGGVGKSTVSALLGLEAAARGLRVLVVVPEGSQPHAGLWGRPIPSEPAEVAPGVESMLAESEAAMRQYTTQVLGSRRVVELLFHSKVARGFLTGIPGLTEWAILGKAWAYTRSAGFPLPDGHAPYDLVILDAPASGDGTKMLRIPDIIADMGASGQIRRDADRCRAMLRDPQKTALVLVTLAEELVLQETEENIEIVRRELQIPLGPLFVNKIQPPPFAESELPLVLDHSPSQDPACQELLCLGQRHAHRQVRQEAHLGRLTRWNLPVVQLPRIAPPFEGLRSLEKLQMALAEGG